MKEPSHHRPGAVRRALTLIELLVVIAIIAMLISILLPSLGGARKTAWTVMCQSNLRQLGIAIQSYLDEQKDAQFLDLHLYNSSGAVITPSYHVGVVDILQPYLGEAGDSRPRAHRRRRGDRPLQDLAWADRGRGHAAADARLSGLALL